MTRVMTRVTRKDYGIGKASSTQCPIATAGLAGGRPVGTLIAPYVPAHGFDQLCGVVTDSVFENGFHILDVINIL